MAELIKIKYEIDTSDVKQAEADLNKLVKSESSLSKEAQATNAQMDKQTVSIHKAEQATKDMQKTLKSGKGGKEVDEISTAVNKLGANLKALPKPNIEKNMQGASQSVGSFGTAIKGLAGIVAGAFAFEKILEFGKAVIDTTAEFQKFSAVLTNTLGSSSAAKQAMNEIQQFAAQTPFSVAELTDSFVKLANSGFVPTQNQMRQLGDIASSTGKDFMQLTEAILDASSGEFERLKEFGIKSSKEGDKITFTFKGVKTQVQNTAESINKYILGLGDLKGVSGGMAAISKTLGGQISNLGDSFDQLKLAIGGISGEGFSVFISGIGNALTWVTNLINGTNAQILAYKEQKNAVDGLVASTNPLIERYLELAKKTGRNTADTMEMERLTKSIAGILPDAATKWDKYGNAIAISALKARELIEAQKELATKTRDEAIQNENIRITEALQRKQQLEGEIRQKAQASKYDARGNRLAGGEALTGQDIKKRAEELAKLNENIAESRATIDELYGRNVGKAKKTELDAIRDAQGAAKEQAKMTEAQIKAQQEAEKDGAKKLRDLRQQNAILSAKDDLDKARLKLKFDRENAEVELKQSSQTVAIKKELATKQALELAEVERKAKADANEKNLQAVLDSQDALFTAEKQKYEKLQAEKTITESEFNTALYGLELESLSKREGAYNAYLATIDTTTKEGVVKFAKTQNDITKLNEDENDKRTENIKQTAETQKELIQKATEAQIAMLELRKKYGTGDVQTQAITDLGAIEASKESDPQAKADKQITAEDAVLQVKLANFDKEYQAELDGVGKLAEVYAMRNAIVADSYDKQIALAQGAGLETTGLEMKKNEAIKISNENEKKQYYSNLNSKLSAVQQYGGQVLNAYAGLSDAFYAGQQRELEAQSKANSAKLASNDNAINITKGRLEKSTGKQKKELQIQLANEENVKRQTLKNAEEIEKKKEQLRKEQAAIKKATSIAEAIVNTAIAVTATLAQTGLPAGLPLAILVGALGAAQVATIIAQPLAKGTLSVKGGVDGKDSVLANLMPGEAVIPTKINRKYATALEAIYTQRVAPEAFESIVNPKQTGINTYKIDGRMLSEANAMRAMGSNGLAGLEGRFADFNASLAPLQALNISQLEVNMDSQGFTQYLQQGNMRTKILGKISA